MAQAFIQGGLSRQEMFKQEQGSLTGGFGPGGVMALFPWILRALAQHGPLICQILTTDVADLVGLVNDLLDLSGKLEREETIKALPADPYQPLKLVMTTLSQELVSSGLPQNQADLVTFRVVRALLDNPQDSKVFVETIGQKNS
ncbi:MAG: hypothetical protein HC929_25560 [Leptolyngbyaceae cyanobacterium SM2_5_2]|nr:hypothetical protein [Leptolyngbyaceae cyanobacterium SM2_5_2]